MSRDHSSSAKYLLKSDRQKKSLGLSASDLREMKLKEKMEEMARLKRAKENERKRLSNLKRLNVNLHNKQAMQMEVLDLNIDLALNEIDRHPKHKDDKEV